MLNRFAKVMLVATSMAPVLGAFGVLSYAEGNSGWAVLQWFFYAAMLLLICDLLMRFARRHIAAEKLTIRSIRGADKEVLAFLVAYLLPLAAKDSLGLVGSLAATVYVFAMIAWTVYHSNAYYFNPLLALLGYHFYEIEAADGMQLMLLTKRTIRKPSLEANVVQLFDYTYLDLGDER